MASASSSCKDFLERTEDLTRISTRSSTKDLYRIMQWPLTEECSRICTACSCENLQWKWRRPRAWEPHGADFVRACAVEMHMDISQEPFYARIRRTDAVPQERDPCFVRACAVETHIHGHVTRASLCENLQELDPSFVQAHMGVSQEHTRAILCENFQDKCRPPEVSRTFSALGLRSRNAPGHLTRTISCENLHKKGRTPKSRGRLCAGLRSRKCTWTSHKSHFMREFQEKCRGSERPPWSNPGLNSYRKNPSVWTRCLGNQSSMK